MKHPITGKKMEIYYNTNGESYTIYAEKMGRYGRELLLKTDRDMWIVATLCPAGNNGSWGQGHYFLYDAIAAADFYDTI